MLTRWCLRPHVTPRHSHKWSESFHELRAWKGSSIILSLKASRESRSVSFREGVEVAVSEREMRMAVRANDENAQEAMGAGGASVSAWLQEGIVL